MQKLIEIRSAVLELLHACRWTGEGTQLLTVPVSPPPPSRARNAWNPTLRCYEIFSVKKLSKCDKRYHEISIIERAKLKPRYVNKTIFSICNRPGCYLCVASAVWNSLPAILEFAVEYGAGSRVVQILAPAKGG
jgi:hypothetical protein